MNKSKRIISGLLAAALVVGTGACGGGGGGRATSGGGNPADNGGGGEAAQTTAAATTTLDPNKQFETEADYDEMANIEEVDTSNEEGAGPKYESGKKAGELNALCYYEFTNVAPENDILKLYAERFGGTVSVTTCTSLEYMEKLGVLIASGDSPDLVRYEWEMIPSGLIQNRFMALDEWLDKDSPVWSDMSDIIESFAYNDKHYYYPQTMSANYGIVYNTANVEAVGGRDPMDLYFSGEWTWTEFEDLLKKWMAVSSDNIGIAMGESSALHFGATAGIAAIEFNGKEIINNMRSPEITKTMQFIEGLAKEGYVYSEWRDPGQGFLDGKLMYYIMPIEWALNSAQEVHFKNNLEGEVRGVPLPKDPDNPDYNILGNTYGYLVPAGAKNVQGAVSWILAGRIYSTDPEVVKARRDLLMYDGAYFYPKCTKCKHAFESEYGEEGDTCPECGEPRKPKFKVTYTEQQMQVLDDMVDPTKFKFLFDCHRGFGTDLTTTIKKVFDDPMKGTDTYTHMLEENYNMIETSLDPYRELIKEALGS